MKNKRNNKVFGLILSLMLLVMGSMFVRAEGLSDDNSLYSLGITTEGAVVSPEFNYGTTEYDVLVPAGTEHIALEPVPSNENASIVEVTGTDLVDGRSTVIITVAAQNGDQYSYVLNVLVDPSSVAAVPETEKAPETEKQTEKAPETEKQTEPQTEDPRFVRVQRDLVEEADNTINSLKEEIVNYRDRISVLMKILYGLIAFGVIMLFIVINLLLKKRDLKSELKRYMGYGYPENNGDVYAESAYGTQEDVYGDYPYPDYQGQDPAQGYEEPYGYDAQPQAQQEYEQPYDDFQYNMPEDQMQEEAPAKPEKKPRKVRAKKNKDDANEIPKPSKARKRTKQMPEYDRPQAEFEYEPNTENSSDSVEVTMIDL